MEPVGLLLPAMRGGRATQEPDVSAPHSSAPPQPAPPIAAPETSRNPAPPKTGPQTPNSPTDPPPVQATASGTRRPTSRSCFPVRARGGPGGSGSQENSGSRPHQARNVRLWEGALCVATASEPQTPPDITRTCILPDCGAPCIPASRSRAVLRKPHPSNSAASWGFLCSHPVPSSRVPRLRGRWDRGAPWRQACLPRTPAQSPGLWPRASPILPGLWRKWLPPRVPSARNAESPGWGRLPGSRETP